MPLQKNETILLSIESLASEGNGVGHHEGEAIFVPASAPGDVLWVQIVKAAKRYAYGRIEKIVTAGPGRQAEDCPISKMCGGCNFRHLTYKAELAAKQGFVQDALRHIGGIDAPVLPILPSPLQDRYRNKVQYPVCPDDTGGIRYGFFANRSHRVVPCEDCLLQPELLNEVAAFTAATLQDIGATPYNEAAKTGLVRHIYLRQGVHTGEVMVCLVVTQDALPKEVHFVSSLTARFPAVKNVLLNFNSANTNVILGKHSRILYGAGFVREEIAGVPLRLDEKSFSQVNTLGAERLFTVVREYAAPTCKDDMLDIYCGAGVIGLSMASTCRTLTGIEVIPAAVESARQSAEEMGLSNTRFLCADAADAAATLQQEGYAPSIILLDPPRKGCDDATLHTVAAMQPQRVVMVSCNPATLARDLAKLSNLGYKTQKAQPVDMFPRTRHVECVVLMTRESIV